MKAVESEKWGRLSKVQRRCTWRAQGKKSNVGGFCLISARLDSATYITWSVIVEKKNTPRKHFHIVRKLGLWMLVTALPPASHDVVTVPYCYWDVSPSCFNPGYIFTPPPSLFSHFLPFISYSSVLETHMLQFVSFKL